VPESLATASASAAARVSTVQVDPEFCRGQCARPYGWAPVLCL